MNWDEPSLEFYNNEVYKICVREIVVFLVKTFLIICEYSFLYLLRFIGNIPNESTSGTLTTKTSPRIATSTKTHK